MIKNNRVANRNAIYVTQERESIMKTLKQNILSILVGIGIGLSVNSTFLAYFATKYESLSSVMIFRSYIASIIIGVVSSLASNLFQMEEEGSLLKKTILHYFVILITVCAVGKWANWMGNISPFFVVFTAIYIVIYAVCYQIGKRKVSEINDALEKKSQR